MIDFLKELNEPQRRAVEYCDGPSLVIAGAGSGKTRVLTYKIAYLLSSGYQPWSILALTFTNKAAREMKQRIAKLVGEELARYLWMGTFHSVFLRILRAEHSLLGFSSNFTIYDANDSKSLVKSIMKEMELDDKTYKSGMVMNEISNAKNAMITAEEYVSNPTFYQQNAKNNVPCIGGVYKRYADRLRLSDAMDFDDILLYTYKLLKENDEILQKYSQRFSYVLVDEYQDTNYVQHQIVWLLSKEHQKVCVVGDDAQSIYSFRGANIDNILTFQRVYNDCQLFKLEQNYRSTQTIVDAANSLIRKNERQIPKDVFSELDMGEKINVFETVSDKEEVGIVIRQIRTIKKLKNCEYSDFAILYRTNAQSRVFEEEMRREHIPYHIYGGISFYQRKEVKDVLAYFRLAVNPHDEECLKRVINYPARGIGNTTQKKVVDAAFESGVSLWTVLEALSLKVSPLSSDFSSDYIKMLEEVRLPDVSRAAATKLVGFYELIRSFMNMASEEGANAEDVGCNIIRKSEIFNDVYQDRTPEGLSRQQNIEQVVSGLSEFVQDRREEGNDNVGLIDYLNEISLISDLDSNQKDDAPKVVLMTVHSAKGLEFPTVFVVGLEENLFPGQSATTSQKELEEERRLFYVAMTRAEKHCFLSYAQSRLRYGKLEFGTASRFISDIDSKYLQRTSSLKSSYKSTSNDDVDLPWRRPNRSTFNSDVDLPWKRSNKHTSNDDADLPWKRPSMMPHMKPLQQVQRASVSSATPVARDVTGIQIGTQVVHERFGKGEVLSMEGTGENTKATIKFENYGTRQLLLKFARLKLF